MPGKIPAWRLDVPGIAGHRGAKGQAPENTLYSMAEALATGATHLEVDVRATRDGVPVCLHDENLDRTTNASGYLEDLDLDEVQEVDPCALWSEFAGIATGDQEPPKGLPRSWFTIPTLDQVLSTFPGVPTILDLKDTAPPQAVAEVVGTWNRTDDLLVAGYDDDVLDETAELLTDVPRGAGRQGSQAFFEGEPIQADVIVLPRTYQGIDLIDPEFIHQAHQDKRGFWVWTINELTDAKELLDMGVDGIITDVPGKLGRLREEHLGSRA